MKTRSSTPKHSTPKHIVFETKEAQTYTVTFTKVFPFKGPLLQLV